MSENTPGGQPADPPSPSAGGAYPPPASPAAPQPPAYGAPTPPPYGSAPAYGSPPAYGAGSYGAAPAYGGYGTAPKTNTLAIVSLIASIVGLVLVPFIGSVVGVITGHMSLSQIKQSGEGGRGMALAGTIVGWVGVGFSVLALIILFAVLPAFLATVSSTSFS